LITLFLQRSLTDERGQAMIEYALILALVTLVCVGTLGAIGTPLNDIFQSVADGF